MLAVEFATRQNWEIKQQTIIGSWLVSISAYLFSVSAYTMNVAYFVCPQQMYSSVFNQPLVSNADAHEKVLCVMVWLLL
jgi:hypothetical protein